MSIMVEFQAEIKSIDETQVISDKFQKRSMIVKLIDEKGNPEYPTWLTIEAKQDKVIEFDQYAPGQVVDAKCFLSGNLWTPTDGRPERAFVGLDLWEMKTAEGSPQGTTPAPQIPEFDPEQDGDVPF
jgi:hypothetical protein